jgi:hypothetical protein
LLAADGGEIPLQTAALSRWPDGSVRWLLLDFQVNLSAGERRQFLLRYGEESRRGSIERPIQVGNEGGAVVIDTGPARLRLAPDAFYLPGQLWLDTNRDGDFSEEEQVTDPQSPGMVLVDGDGHEFHSTSGRAEITVEQAGPLRVCVRVAGHHASTQGRMFRYVARIHAFRGQPFLRMFTTFINDHQDSLMAQVRELDLQVRLAPVAGRPTLAWLDAKPHQGKLFQVDENQYLVDGQLQSGRAAGWAAVGGQQAGLAVGVREFWQNWPKSIECAAGEIRIGLCPRLEPGTYDGKPLAEENKLYYHLRDGRHTLKVGVAKTHELWATCFGGQADHGELEPFFQAAEHPLLATCDPQYVDSTTAVGELPPADRAKYFGYDAWLDRALQSHLKRRDEVREYGMLNYGDWFGERGVNWGNLEYDLAHGLFLQSLRTGERRFYRRAEQAARHHIDVDVVHAVNSHLKNPWGAPPRVGDIWLHCLNHTGGYYEDAPLPVSRTYQMGHSTNFGHVWVSGDLDYYYLTGDRRALEVSIQIADAMASHMPTQYGTHIRGLGWPMILVLDAYHATGDPKYLAAATKNWEVLKRNIDWDRGWVVRLASDHCTHPEESTREQRETIYREQRCEGNVPFMEGLTLCALARYHRVTGDPDVLKAISVGIDQMIRECWQEDVKTFRYTACPLSSKTPYALFMLSTEAMAYEAAQTGNQEHSRILREGIRAAIPEGDGNHFGKGLAQMIFFTPHALGVFKDSL